MEDNKTMMENEAMNDAELEQYEKDSAKKLLIGAAVVGVTYVVGKKIVKKVVNKKVKPAIKNWLREVIRDEMKTYEGTCEECAEDSTD